MVTSVRIAVVGDVHDDWNLQEDTKALQLLQPDLVLFTGDFGNENVELVRSVADLTIAKAIILGNHDAWSTREFSGRKKDSVQLQLDCLGEEHVGYRRLDFPVLKLSIVGGRPFSCGGQKLFRHKLLSARFGVNNMEESAKRIYKAALGIPEDHSIIFLAHNGPTGLGSNINDICGRDWVYGGGDHGDPDLEHAISQLKETTKLSVPLVVFGHMHKQLVNGNGLRKMIVVGDDSSVYLNRAIVPRVKRLADEHRTDSKTPLKTENPLLTAFTIFGQDPRLVYWFPADFRCFHIVSGYISGGPMERKALDEDAETSAVCGFIDDDVIDEVEEGRSDDDDQVERVCAICDNGGDLLCCEGECMRSFHATEEDNCESLGFSKEQVGAICNFCCKNCQYRRHQCFACGKLGSSDKKSAAAEVFRCVSGECGRFYHPCCVSKLLHRDSEAESEVLKEKIANGASFTCPFHKCCVCNQGETEEEDELRFAMCRRCPKSYHKKCLPREISFEDLEEDDIIQRAWEDLMPKKRILIYCLEHEIDDDIGTPVRNHVRFPAQASELLSRRERAPVSENASRRRTSVRPVLGRDKLSSATMPDSLKEQRVRDISRKPLNKTSSKVKSTPDESKTFHTVKSVAKETSNILPLDAESKRRILALMKDVSSKITLEKINEKHKPPTTQACSSKNVIDKTITLGKVEGSVEALRAALRKLEEGCSIEDAKAVCGPGLLSQMMKWKIVDMLHWYAQDGDMIVDFGCGANEFSCLMKKKLDEIGKKCSYKNYDIIYPKNDFNFEQKDWLTVHPKELPPGSQLIMGLNPPFGVNANLANQFINKALECKPKLIVLIVPPETERLDEKDPPYDLVFEDNELLAGKSFYLPGSVDVNNKQMEQWNQIPPPLYFWSRQDWTAKHKAIGQQQGHLHRGREVSHMVGNHNEMHITDFAVEGNELNGETSMLLDSHRLQTEEPEQLQEKAASVTENHKEELPCANRSSEGRENHENGNQKKSRGGKGKRKRGLGEISPEDKQRSKRSLPCQSQPAETPLDKGVEKESYQHLDGGFSGPHQLREGHGGAGEDDMARKYGTNYEDPRSRKSQEQFSGYPRESVDNNGYRSHIDDSASQRSSYMVSPDPRSSPYGSAADSSYNRMCSSTSTSTMQRYAPRLDELNPTRTNNLGSELPSVNRNSVCDRPAPTPVHRGDSLGFAPGPYRPYSQNNSAGWLNE